MTVLGVSIHIEKDSLEKWKHDKDYQQKTKEKVIQSMLKKLEEVLYDNMYIVEEDIDNGKQFVYLLGLESKEGLIRSYLRNKGLSNQMVGLLEEAGLAEEFIDNCEDVLSAHTDGIEAIKEYVRSKNLE